MTPAVPPVSAENAWFSQAFIDVGAARRRQIEVNGYDYTHDDEHDRGELAMAGAVYAWFATWSDQKRASGLNPVTASFEVRWPFLGGWNPKDRRSDLVRAGALIVAEIERLDRVAVRA